MCSCIAGLEWRADVLHRAKFQRLTLTYNCPGRGGTNLTSLRFTLIEGSLSPSSVPSARLLAHPIYPVKVVAPIYMRPTACSGRRPPYPVTALPRFHFGGDFFYNLSGISRMNGFRSKFIIIESTPRIPPALYRNRSGDPLCAACKKRRQYPA